MGRYADIKIHLKQTILPKEILQAFIDNGYNYIVDGKVHYLESDSLRDESYDWQFCLAESFDIEAFIERLKPDDVAVIGLAKDGFWANVYIYPDRIKFDILHSEDIPYLDFWDFQDFSWCLLNVAFLADHVEPESIECFYSR